MLRGTGRQSRKERRVESPDYGGFIVPSGR